MKYLYLVGVIVGLILISLQASHVINIGWFWAIFPIWILPAATISLALIVSVLVIFMIFIANQNLDNIFIAKEDKNE